MEEQAAALSGMDSFPRMCSPLVLVHAVSVAHRIPLDVKGNLGLKTIMEVGVKEEQTTP